MQRCCTVQCCPRPGLDCSTDYPGQGLREAASVWLTEKALLGRIGLESVSEEVEQHELSSLVSPVDSTLFLSPHRRNPWD